MRFCKIISIALWAILLVCTAATAQTVDRIILPDGLFYYQPASTVYGTEAAWVNPAGLGRYPPFSWQLMADYFDGKYGRSWGGVVGRERVTVAFRYLDVPEQGVFREWVYAGGMQLLGGYEIGASYRYFTDGPGLYNHRHFWNIGVSGKSGQMVRWGAVFSNLNRGKVDGRRTATEMRFSVAYRPLNQKFTFAVDMFLSSRTRLPDADYVYHLEVKPTRGLYIYGQIDSDRNFSLGFRANILQYFGGSRSRFARDGGGRGTTVFAGKTEAKQPSMVRPRARRLTVGLSGNLPENPIQPVFGRKETPFPIFLTNLYRAAKDETIGEVLLDLKRVSLGFAQAQELREAIRCLRANGKRVVCYLQGAGNLSYYTATAADRIVLAPVSRLNLVGLRAELTFYTGILDKLGVELDIVRVGEYKTAPEAYTRRAASAENQEQMNRLLDDLFAQFVEDIADGRGLNSDSVRALIENGPFTSAEAISAGLVDGLSYRDQLVPDFVSDGPTVSFNRYLSDTLAEDSWRQPPTVAIVVAEGDIGFRKSHLPIFPGGDLSPQLMSQAVSQALQHRGVQGMVLRIDSPGGYALAGEEIHREIAKASERMPVTVSIGNVAASGGYYIGMASERVFASPASITGSIGIYGGKADLSRMYEMLDLGKELYTRGRFAGMMSYTQAFTEDEREKYSHLLESFYGHFVSLVASNQGLPEDSVDAISRGQVWTGREAEENGLVDELGGLHQALDYAADRIGAEEYRLALFPRRKVLFQLPAMSLFGGLGRWLGLGGDTDVTELLDPATDGEAAVLARLPYDIIIE